jgi:hypothetical protein
MHEGMGPLIHHLPASIQVLGMNVAACRWCSRMPSSLQAGCFGCVSGGGDANECILCSSDNCFDCVANEGLSNGTRRMCDTCGAMSACYTCMEK